MHSCHISKSYLNSSWFFLSLLFLCLFRYFCFGMWTSTLRQFDLICFTCFHFTITTQLLFSMQRMCVCVRVCVCVFVCASRSLRCCPSRNKICRQLVLCKEFVSSFRFGDPCRLLSRIVPTLQFSRFTFYSGRCPISPRDDRRSRKNRRNRNTLMHEKKETIRGDCNRLPSVFR